MYSHTHTSPNQTKPRVPLRGMSFRGRGSRFPIDLARHFLKYKSVNDVSFQEPKQTKGDVASRQS